MAEPVNAIRRRQSTANHEPAEAITKRPLAATMASAPTWGLNQLIGMDDWEFPPAEEAA